MAKRFITTEIFDDSWFMDLPAKYKLFWLYLITKCDHTGIWQVNYKLAQFYVGEHLEPIECERFLKDRIIKIGNGKYWFIEKFIQFQYGNVLSPTNPAVRKVIAKLKESNLVNHLSKVTVIEEKNKGAFKELSRSYEASEEEEEDKEEEKDKLKRMFDEFRKLYPGEKRGLDTEFNNLVKKHKDWRKVLPKLLNALTDQIADRERKEFNKDFVPKWKHLQTWINNRWWEVETSVDDQQQPIPKSIPDIKDGDPGWR